MTPPIPDFAQFFEAVHGYPPFPWQSRLAETVLQQGWPELLDLPTGVGKTTALDVALYTLAAANRDHARRILLVVDRRIVVDQGAEHARTILQRMMAEKSGPLSVVAARLRATWSASTEAAPFAIAVLRGGMPRDNDWARRPDQPVVGVSTVDQVGSRLLFRGYGIGRQSASIHAGLLGRDTLMLLDEVHLSEPFAETVKGIQGFQTHPAGLPQGLVAVRMSATPATISDATFALDQADKVHPVLSQRLNARKLARLETVTVTGKNEADKQKKLAQKAVQEALSLQKHDRNVVAVVVNRVATARAAFEFLRSKKDSPPCALVTGRMRPLERDRVVAEILMPRAGAGRDRSQDEPFVVVATQCIEAGADLDFDAIVTEVASLDALRQRFGRVDRRGERGDSHSVILCRSDQQADWEDPVYGVALPNTWQWLSDLSDAVQLDFGVSSLDAVLEQQADVVPHLLPPRAVAPVLLPSHLDSFAQTSPRPKLDHDVEIFLHGPARESRDVQVVWRDELPLKPDHLSATIDQLVLRRPVALEAMTLPIWVVQKWLKGETDASDLSDTPIRREAEQNRRRRSENPEWVGIRWNGDTGEPVAATEIAPGDVIVVSTQRGGISAGSFDSNAFDRVADLSTVAILRARRTASLWLDRSSLRWLGFRADWCEACPQIQDDETAAEFRRRVDAWLAEDSGGPSRESGMSDDEWKTAISALRSRRRRITLVGDRPLVEVDVPNAAAVAGDAVGEATTESSGPSPAAKPISIEEHCARVRQYAAAFAENIGLSPELKADVEAAAWFHDIGKADPRFQRLLCGGSELDALMNVQTLAKSTKRLSPAHQNRARALSGYPTGFRHELVSVGLLAESHAISDAADQSLVLHLVASHHGWCRPFAPAVADSGTCEIELDHGDKHFSGVSDHGLERLSSGVAQRFFSLCERYDRWGLAFLEAIVRLADHRASEEESEA